VVCHHESCDIAAVSDTAPVSRIPGISGDIPRGLDWGVRAYSERTLVAQDWRPCCHTKKGTNIRNKENARRALFHLEEKSTISLHVTVASPN